MNLVKYSARVIERIDNGPNTCDSLVVGVFLLDNDHEEQVGSYKRNYSGLYDTFAHFRKNGRDYALYSPCYTSTRVMELPSCKDIGGEVQDKVGFCPTEYCIPWHNPSDPTKLYPVNFGLVAGCYWGDDSSWKIQYLDLSRVEEGVIVRDDRFGYIKLPESLTLGQAVSLQWYDPEDDDPEIRIITFEDYELKTGKPSE